ncbi:MAG: zinc-binding dehydrogenase [Lentisphaeria bacterium]|nr:zinc-binding dehydrogenase [Lentisphaeria bacterium]
MKAVITDGKGNVKLQDIEMVRPAEYQCLCRIDACATCSGTDQKLVNSGFAWADKYPAILGHEGVGTIIECGKNVKNFKVGDRVLRPAVALPGTMYGELASWMGGFAEYGLVTDIKAVENVSPDIDPFGYTRYQQVIPADCDISNADATMLVMLKEVAGACKGANITKGHTVLVLGAGAVAQAMCFFSSFAGAKVIVAARRAEPLELCRRCGADVTVNLFYDNLEEIVMQETCGNGVDRVMDAAGNVDLAVRGANLLADGGGIASYATVEGGSFPKERISPKGSWQMLESAVPENCMHEEIIAMYNAGKLNPALFYTHKMDFAEFENGFPLLGAKKAGKIVFEM